MVHKNFPSFFPYHKRFLRFSSVIYPNLFIKFLNKLSIYMFPFKVIKCCRSPIILQVEHSKPFTKHNILCGIRRPGPLTSFYANKSAPTHTARNPISPTCGSWSFGFWCQNPQNSIKDWRMMDKNSLVMWYQSSWKIMTR